MKPLTIEELKSLKVGDWVWILDFSKTVYKPISDSGSYYRIDDSGKNTDKELWCHCSAIGHGFNYSDYGKTWLAYKNKEQAEAKGEIVELPCKLGQKLYAIISETIYDAYAGEIILCEDGRFKFELLMSIPIRLTFGENIFTDKIEAERHLAELKGENK